jgi:hypothetical protein
MPRVREHGHDMCTNQIQRGKGETSIFLGASQNVTTAAMIMIIAPEPSIDDEKHIHKEL